MKYYLDITLLPGEEIELYFLWEKVYQQVHLALVEHLDSDNHSLVAAAFPGYRWDQSRSQLGRKLRLLAAAEESLTLLNLPEKLAQFSDYVHITTCREVPKTIHEWVQFRRKQYKSSKTRLATRKAKREGIDYQTACQRLGDFAERHSTRPFISMKSLSSGQFFPLIIEKQQVDKAPFEKPQFNGYGLAKSGWLPNF